MYWEKNWNASMSLMKEASEHGAPAYLLTVRGSVHINQSDFSILYRHMTSFFMKATVNPERAVDLNVGTSLEFIRLVTPDNGGGKSIINRCMTDEHILETPLTEETPDDHRPDDEWIAARLRVDNPFRRRIASGLQRKFKRNIRESTGEGYTTSDEMWCFFKPTDEKLQEWIDKEERGEKRIDEGHATVPNRERQHSAGPVAHSPNLSASLSDAEKDDRSLRSEDGSDDSKDISRSQRHRSCSPQSVRNKYHSDDQA
jgi:platelet-activating factor acetylhydrolase